MRLLSSSKVLVRRKSDGKYLILQSGDWPEKPLRSHKPDLPGGLVEPGETTLLGGARELKEETGIKVSEDQLILAYANSRINNDAEAWSLLVYSVEIDYDPEIVLSWEHEDYHWLNSEEVLGLDIRPAYPEIFKYLNRIGILR